MSRITLLGLLLFTCRIDSFASERLGDTLRAAKIPTEQFASSELNAKITSYAISTGDPFLLAYYQDNGSGRLQPPLHVIRYGRNAQELQRAAFETVEALFKGEIAMNCLGSALAIREYNRNVYLH